MATRRKPPKGYSSWKAWSAALRRKQRKGGHSVAHRRKRTSKRRRRGTRTVTLLRSRRRTYRSNPPLTLQRAPQLLIRGVQDAAIITVGKAGSRALPQLIGLPADSSPMGLAVVAAAAVGVGLVGHQLGGRDVGRLALAGALTAPIEGLIRAMNIPMLSAALGDDLVEVPMGAYPDALGMGAYPDVGLGQDEMEPAYSY